MNFRQSRKGAINDFVRNLGVIFFAESDCVALHVARYQLCYISVIAPML